MPASFPNDLPKYLGRYSTNHKESAGSPAPLKIISVTGDVTGND
tara:strand:+ start:2987 stop:3118 length:132 start_codon:yes stop_codon:yes gene_type:complete